MTALHHAAFSGVATTVKILLEWGGKNDMDDKSGKSPLWYAVESGDEDCVGTLLDYKANPNDKR
jgi:ankyrin repeat protein